MSILDEYQIKPERELSVSDTAQQVTEQIQELNVVDPDKTADNTIEQIQETTQDAEMQTTADHIKIDTVQENSVSQFANEEIARMNSYLKKYPEKTIHDYNALTTPIESLKEDDLIRSYLSEKEGKTKSQIDYALKQLELKEEDPDFDGEFGSGDTDLENLKKKGDR